MATNNDIAANVAAYNVLFPAFAIPTECPAPDFMHIYLDFIDGIPSGPLDIEIVESINTPTPDDVLT